MYIILKNIMELSVKKTQSADFCKLLSGGAMVLRKFPVPGHPTIWIIVGQGPIALAVGAGGGLFVHIFSHLSFLFFLPLSGRRLDID